MSGDHNNHTNNKLIRHDVVTSEALEEVGWGQTCTIQRNKQVFSPDMKVARVTVGDEKGMRCLIHVTRIYIVSYMIVMCVLISKAWCDDWDMPEMQCCGSCHFDMDICFNCRTRRHCVLTVTSGRTLMSSVACWNSFSASFPSRSSLMVCCMFFRT